MISIFRLNFEIRIEDCDWFLSNEIYSSVNKRNALSILTVIGMLMSLKNTL